MKEDKEETKTKRKPLLGNYIQKNIIVTEYNIQITEKDLDTLNGKKLAQW